VPPGGRYLLTPQPTSDNSRRRPLLSLSRPACPELFGTTPSHNSAPSPVETYQALSFRQTRHGKHGSTNYQELTPLQGLRFYTP
jgi:hypothetical protein